MDWYFISCQIVVDEKAAPFVDFNSSINAAPAPIFVAPVFEPQKENVLRMDGGLDEDLELSVKFPYTEEATKEI